MNLVRRLVDLTERSAATRDLCLAIEQEDRELVETLLAAGVCCEFEESDWPSPEPSDDCTSWDAGLLRESALTPPLARAVRLGSGELVRLLLAHGADAKVLLPPSATTRSWPMVSCPFQKSPADGPCSWLWSLASTTLPSNS
ncbi:hypothetical protein MY8738_000748 [Beauveria namnaoensis]